MVSNVPFKVGLLRCLVHCQRLIIKSNFQMSYWTDHMRLLHRPYDISRKVWDAQFPAEPYRKEKSIKRLSTMVQDINQENQILARKLESLIQENHMLKRMELNRNERISYQRPARNIEANIMPSVRSKYIGSSLTRRPVTRYIENPLFVKTGKSDSQQLQKNKSQERLQTDRSGYSQRLMTDASTTPFNPSTNALKTERSLQQSPIFTGRSNQTKISRQKNKDKTFKQESIYSITIAPTDKPQSVSPSRVFKQERDSLNQQAHTANKPIFFNLPQKQQMYQPFSLTEVINNMNQHMERKAQLTSKPSLNPQLTEYSSDVALQSNKSPKFGVYHSDNQFNNSGTILSDEPAIPSILSSKKLSRNKSLSQRSKKQYITLVSSTKENQ